MSAPQHSPRPWRVKGKKGSIWNENSWIASVWGADREANQALIAAAPDLLAALKSAEGHLEEMRQDAKWHPIGHCPVLDLVRAAIAKAEKVVTSDNAERAKAEGKAPQ